MAAGFVAAAVLGGCATPPPADEPEAMESFNRANDPIEPFNRAVFDFNLVLDKAILKPIAFVYKEGVPDPMQDWVTNFLANLRSPIILVNDVLQFEFDRAGNTLFRFFINSTYGIIGIADVAAEMGVPRHDEDFGQTLAVHGAEEGAYLMLPLLGPSNPRDALGLVFDILTDPFTYVGSTEFGLARSAATAVDARARRYDTIEELERTSLDYYATVRSLYRQRRNDEIRNGAPSATPPAPRLSFEQDIATPDGKDQYRVN